MSGKIKGLSFRTKLLLIVEILVISSLLLSGAVIYKNIQNLNREILKKKLVAIAASTASVIDGDEIKKIQNIQDAQTETYQKINQTIFSIQKNNEDVGVIYIMTKSERENIWQFIFSTYTENLETEPSPEEFYQYFKKDFDVTNYPQMKQAFERKIADEKIVCDSWGCWLSGYAPIYDSEGQAVAIVGVDISDKEVALLERTMKLSILSIISLVFFTIPIILYFFIDYFTRPFKQIISSLEKFSQKLNTRIQLKSKDEFGIIAESFNKMANTISYSIRNTEKEIKERTREIAEEKNKIDSILKSIGDGVFVVDTEKRITMFNKEAEKITGFKTEEVLGKKTEDILKFKNPSHNDNRKKACFIEEAMTTGKIQKRFAATLLMNKNKKLVPVSKSASPLINQEGQTVGAVVVFRDITHEYEIDRAKTEFVSLASHQLRTPLSSINWYTELLLAGDVGKITPSQKEYLNEIYQGNKRMIQLVNSLLGISRMEMESFVIEPIKIDIIGIAEEAIKELTPKVEEKKLTVKRIYSSEIPLVKTDPKLMRIIFQNLLSNAVKYGKVESTIEISIAKDLKNLRIKIKDEGLGIPKEQQKNIFSKFFRADNAYHSETEGTGLGLYLVKQIVESAEGKIKFQSEENKGTVFFVSLPLSGMKARKGDPGISDIETEDFSKSKKTKPL